MSARAYAQEEFQSNFASDSVKDGVVPRISIEAFCETKLFAKAIEDAAHDRRMSKASVAVQMGGVVAAVDRYFDATTPNLLILEVNGVEGEIFGHLEELAEVCDANTKVLVAGDSNDVTLYRELIRQGVEDYLVTPAAPMQLIDSITTIYAEENAAPRARTIGFTSARGGVGSSTICHNIAFEIAQHGQREVMLVDMDLEFGTAALDFNIEPTRSILDALRSLDEMDDVKLRRLIVDQTERLKLLAAPTLLDIQFDLDSQSAISLVDIIRQSTDLAVFDFPHGWSDWHRSAMLQMDELILVGTPDLTSLRNLKNLYDTFVSRRPNDPAPKVVLNQLGVCKQRPEIPVREFSDILGADPDMVLQYDGRLFGAAANGGQMLSEVSANSRAALDILKLAKQLTDKKRGRNFQEKKKKGFFDFMKK